MSHLREQGRFLLVPGLGFSTTCLCLGEKCRETILGGPPACHECARPDGDGCGDGDPRELIDQRTGRQQKRHRDVTVARLAVNPAGRPPNHVANITAGTMRM